MRRLLLVLHGTEIARSRVPATRVVESFDAFEYALSCHLASRVRLVMDPFLVPCRKEAFYHHVIPSVRSAAHAASDVVLSQQSLIGTAGILAAAVAVMQ